MEVREKRGRLPAFTAIAAIVAAVMMLPATIGSATTNLPLQSVDIGDEMSEWSSGRDGLAGAKS